MKNAVSTTLLLGWFDFCTSGFGQDVYEIDLPMLVHGVGALYTCAFRRYGGSGDFRKETDDELSNKRT